MKKANNILLKVLGILLLTGAAMKGWQLLTEPMANKDIWSYRPFLIFVIEFEIALGIWLLSGLFKKAAWLAILACFSMFSIVTLYKGLTGAASCGCFGSVHVNPWITLFAVDIPAVIALVIFRPALSFLRKQESIAAFVQNVLIPLPSIPRFAAIFSVGIVILAVTGCVLVFNEPAKTTTSYEVLEPETWVGKKLPVLEHIDIGEQLKKGNWLLLFYHYDCPDCITAISNYEQIARDLTGNEDFLRIALIEVPPYGQLVSQTSPCTLGQLPETKEWFVTTPAAVLLTNGIIKSAWEAKVPDFDTIIETIAILKDQKLFISTKHYSKTLERRWC
jgi:hypothetical protein